MDAKSDPTGAVDRRRFLGLTFAGSAALLLGAMGTPAAAAPGDETMQVFTLSPDWGYARGPNNKTRLVSRASRQAAANRVALSSADAEAMNLHLCSYAPAVPQTVRREEFMAIWDRHSYMWTNPWSGLEVRLLDLRRVGAELPATGADLGAVRAGGALIAVGAAAVALSRAAKRTDRGLQPPE